jgi:hypothetical protein
MMIGWIFLGFYVFRKFPHHRAVIVGFLGAWLFLPQYAYDLPALPNYSKSSAPGYVILAAALLFDSKTLKAFRPHICDLPVAAFCVAPLLSSLSNGLGAWDGTSASVARSTEWLIPYFLGRAYCGSPRAIRDLALGVFLGGLLYVPLCLFEVRMSPQLHAMVYGYHPHSFEQSKRWGGWRPVVFMKHGLMVGMWMTMASLAGVAALGNGQLKWTRRIPLMSPVLLVTIVLITTILCKSTGALALFIVGVLMLFAGLRLRTSVPYFLLLLSPIVYVLLRANGLWDVQNLIEAMHRVLPERRVGSFAYRIYNENLLLEKAFQQKWFGWGGWQRSFVFDDLGRPISVPDGFWVLVFGKNGLFGLVSMLLALLLPQALFLKRFSASGWSKSPTLSAAYLLALLLSLFMVDSLMNDMFNPMVVVTAGGISSLALSGEIADDPIQDTPRALGIASAVYKPRLV